jgi:hypothetical protein
MEGGRVLAADDPPDTENRSGKSAGASLTPTFEVGVIVRGTVSFPQVGRGESPTPIATRALAPPSMGTAESETTTAAQKLPLAPNVWLGVESEVLSRYVPSPNEKVYSNGATPPVAVAERRTASPRAGTVVDEVSVTDSAVPPPTTIATGGETE